MNTAKRCDEDEYPARPAQRAAVLVKGGEAARGKDHLGATELNGNALKPRRLASLSALSGSGQAPEQREWYRRGITPLSLGETGAFFDVSGGRYAPLYHRQISARGGLARPGGACPGHLPGDPGHRGGHGSVGLSLQQQPGKPFPPDDRDGADPSGPGGI